MPSLRSSKNETHSRHTRPGSPRKGLAHLSTEDHNSKKPGFQPLKPRLSRSATVPTIANRKRENSQPAMPAANREPSWKSKAFSRREVDLTTSTSVGDKFTKKSNVEAALKEAISTLKAPNRVMAVKEILQSVDRFAKGASVSKRKGFLLQFNRHADIPFLDSRKPLKVLSDQSVQVMATPKRQRNTNALSDIPMHLENASSDTTRRPAIKEHQSNMYIPASADKPYVLTVPESSPPSFNNGIEEHRQYRGHDTARIASNKYLSNIASTPLATKGATDRPRTAGCIESLNQIMSPLPFGLSNLQQGDDKYVEETPSKRRMSCGSLTHSSNAFSLGVSRSRPCETGMITVAPHSSTMLSSPPFVESSIYDKLGWDNDDDDPF